MMTEEVEIKIKKNMRDIIYTILPEVTSKSINIPIHSTLTSPERMLSSIHRYFHANTPNNLITNLEPSTHSPHHYVAYGIYTLLQSLKLSMKKLRGRVQNVINRERISQQSDCYLRTLKKDQVNYA